MDIARLLSDMGDKIIALRLANYWSIQSRNTVSEKLTIDKNTLWIIDLICAQKEEDLTVAGISKADFLDTICASYTQAPDLFDLAKHFLKYDKTRALRIADLVNLFICFFKNI